MQLISTTSSGVGGGEFQSAPFLHVQATKQTISVNANISLQQAFVPSAAAMDVIQYVAASSRLSPSEKTSVIRLAAFIDHYAQGNPELLEKLAAVVQLMEMNADGERYGKMSSSRALETYTDMRETLAGKRNLSFTLSVSLQLEMFSLSATGLSTDEVMQELGVAVEVDVLLPGDATGDEESLPLPGNEGVRGEVAIEIGMNITA